jgi:hypothetical protein
MEIKQFAKVNSIFLFDKLIILKTKNLLII